MPYTDRFQSTDNLITRLSPIISAVTDQDVKNSYAGLLAVSSITAYELAIKDIFIAFSIKKNKVFGAVIESHFSKLNGRIMYRELRGSHISMFGQKYLDKFDKEFKAKEENSLAAATPISLITQYNNLILCRHKFVHGGTFTLTVNEVIQAFTYGKEIIHSLNTIMVR